MRDGLQLAARLDEGGWLDLTATVRSHGFSGASTALFGEAELRQFASALKAFPLGDEARRGVSSALWDQPASPDRYLVSLAAFQLDAVGHVAMRIRLGASMENWERPLRHLIEVDFRTTYGAIDNFAVQLIELLDGTRSEALLPADHAT